MKNYAYLKTKYKLVKWLNWFYEFKKHENFSLMRKNQLFKIYCNIRNNNGVKATPLRGLT